MALDPGYKIVVTIEVTKHESYNTVTIAKKTLEEETIGIDAKTPAKNLNRKITELVADAKTAVSDMLYAIESKNKESEESL